MPLESKYSIAYCELIKELMSEGASIEEVAGEIGVVKQTLYNWCDKYPDFMDAKKVAEQLSTAWWYKQGRIALRDKEFSPTLFYMNMKNRFGWRDKNESATVVTVKGVISADPLTGDQWEEEYGK